MEQNFDDFSKIWLQSLMTLRGNGGILLDRDYSIMLDNIKEYQLRVLHNLSVENNARKVDNNKILTLVKSQRILHQLIDMSFEDMGLAEAIRTLYKTNHEVLSKFGMDKPLDYTLSQSSTEVMKSEQKYFDDLVDQHLENIVADFKEKEAQEISDQAMDIAECLLLGIPRQYLKTSRDSGEEHLHDLLESIYQEAQQKNEQNVQDLSLFNQSKNLADYQSRKQQSLNEILDSVADCVVRNHERETLLSQKPRRD